MRVLRRAHRSACRPVACRCGSATINSSPHPQRSWRTGVELDAIEAIQGAYRARRGAESRCPLTTVRRRHRRRSLPPAPAATCNLCGTASMHFDCAVDYLEQCLLSLSSNSAALRKYEVRLFSPMNGLPPSCCYLCVASLPVEQGIGGWPRDLEAAMCVLGCREELARGWDSWCAKGKQPRKL